MITHAQKTIGISAIGLAIPTYAMPLSELATIRNTDPTAYTDSLGCHTMSLCGPDENVITLAVKAAQRALNTWNRKPEDIGMVIVATETGIDMSRPLSAWVMQALGLSGAIRSYEVKHACYGGTAAIRQAVEWKLSGNCKQKAALVIAADVALYAPGHSGEPTQGAGAFAAIIDEPNIASIEPVSYYWSEPQFDFWRPISNKYPEVNGKLSLSSYINATLKCFEQLASPTLLADLLYEYKFINMHVPFPKMVQKSIKKLGELCNWSVEKTNQFYQEKVLNCMEWNQQIGNCYTASLWFSIANALTKTKLNEQLLGFSYGSGYGAELLTLRCAQNSQYANWASYLQQDFTERKLIDAKTYIELRKAI